MNHSFWEGVNEEMGMKLEAGRKREEASLLLHTGTRCLHDILKYSELGGWREDASPSPATPVSLGGRVSVFLCQKGDLSPSFGTHRGYKE